MSGSKNIIKKGFDECSDKDKEKKSSEEETAEVKKEAEAESGAAAAGEKDKESAKKSSAAETPQDRLIKDGQLQSAATVGLRHL